MSVHTFFCVFLLFNWVHCCPEKCGCPNSYTVQCMGFIPRDILHTTVSVTITNPPVIIYREMFAGLNWENVSRLTFICDPNIPNSYTGQIKLESEAFQELLNLRHLTVTKFDQYIVNSTECDSFKGIEGLTSLNLDGTLYFYMRKIVCAMELYLHNLEVIRLADVDISNTAHIDTDFLLAFGKTNAKVLDISGLYVGFTDLEKIKTLFPYLQKLIWRRCKNPFNFAAALNERNYRFPGSLYMVDISETTYIRRNWNIEYSKRSPNLLLYSNIKEFKLNDIFDEVNIHAGTYDLSGSRTSVMVFHWEHLEMMHNGWQTLNFSITDQLPFLTNLNLAYNKISFISPLLPRSFQNLKTLNLSHNTLEKMENRKEFSDLLVYLPNLESITLAYNGLSTLPLSFFRNGYNLTIIDLSSNKIDTISCQFDHLQNLKYLNLQSNRLRTISVDSLTDLSRLNQEDALVVNISDNPFVCGCDSDSEANLENIIKYSILFQGSYMTCNFGHSHLPMTEESRQTIRETCQRKTTVIMASSCLAIFVILSIITTVIVNRRLKQYRKKKHLLDLIKLYKVMDTEPSFLVFLSYSSADSKFVDDTVYPQLDGKLQEILQTDKELVFNGDLHFQAGRRIEDEIVKAVDSSKVVILLISEAFCSSPWCDYETMVSYYEKKPIILMMKEDVPKRKMPSVLRKLFDRYVRAMWKDVNGTMTLQPGLDKLCQSIIDQATV